MKRRERSTGLFRGSVIIAALALYLVAGSTELFAGPMMPYGRQPGVYHHSMGHAGKGVCPQPRFTEQAPEDIYRQKNPLEPTQKNIDAGAALFRRDVQPTACKICHGEAGNGLGMMAQGLNPPPRNFTCAETMKEIPDGQMFWIINNGSPGTGMPAYRDLAETEIWQIVHYLRKLAK